MSVLETDGSLFEVTVINEDFDFWINKPYIGVELKDKLKKANVLLVPREGFRGDDTNTFPVGTEEFLRFINDNKGPGIDIDICIEDSEYKELALHDASLVIAGFFVTSIVAPIIADLIAEYIKKRWTSKKDTATIKVEMYVQECKNKSKKFLYKGSAKDFIETVKPALLELNKPKDK